MTSSSTVFDKLSKAAEAKSIEIVSINDNSGTFDTYNWDVSPAYVTRVERLFNHYKEEFKIDLASSSNEEDLITFGYWLANTRITNLTSNTWKSYRSALNAVIQHSERFRTIIMEAKAPSASSLPRRGSRKRRKAVSDRQLAKIVSELDVSESKYAADALRWIAVTLNVGLRPKEWLNANIMTKHDLPFLVVMNAKRTKNALTDSQGILLKRHIPLWHLDQDVVTLIDEHISFVTTHFSNAYEFHKYYESLRVFINSVMNRSGATAAGRTFGLYSCRQQFAANLKASDIDKELKAYLMGHNKYQVMKNHYGATKNGKPIISFTPEQTRLLFELREADIHYK